jgi:hypothetical protein
MPKGLFQPKNFAPDTGGGFKEGMVRVEKSAFTVHKSPDPENPQKGYVPRVPFCALKWTLTRLDEDLDPIKDDEGTAITEVAFFSLGGKSLVQVHPGNGSSADDEEVEDLGDTVGVEGNTLFLIASNFQLHPKSGGAHLFASLKAKDYSEDYLDRVWAPDFEGMVCFMKNVPDPEVMITGNDGKERPTPFKVVEKIIVFPYKNKGAGKTTGKTKDTGPKVDAETESTLSAVLQKLSEELDGQKLSKKALANRVATALQKAKIASKQQITVLELVKNEAWLKKNAGLFDLTVNEDGSITFGTLKEDE